MNPLLKIINCFIGNAVAYFAIVGIPAFVFLGMMIISPICIIGFYGVDPSTTVRDILTMYPMESSAISMGVAILVVGLTSTYKTYNELMQRCDAE